MELTLKRDGAAILPGLLSASDVQRYAEAVRRLHATGARDIAPAEVSALDANLTLERLFAAPAIHAAIRSVVGEAYYTDLGVYSTVGAGQGGITFHTDGLVQGSAHMTLTAWAPLHLEGNAPRLCFLRASYREVRKYLRATLPGRKLPGWSSATEWNSTGAFELDNLLTRFDRARFYTPRVAVGNVVVFTNWSIHGTHRTAETTGTRHTAILRYLPTPRPSFWQRLTGRP